MGLWLRIVDPGCPVGLCRRVVIPRLVEVFGMGLFWRMGRGVVALWFEWEKALVLGVWRSGRRG